MQPYLVEQHELQLNAGEYGAAQAGQPVNLSAGNVPAQVGANLQYTHSTKSYL